MHVIQSRFKRTGTRWKQPSLLNLLALQIARLKGTFQAFWASRGLAVHYVRKVKGALRIGPPYSPGQEGSHG